MRRIPEDAYEMPSCEVMCPSGPYRPVCDEEAFPCHAALCRRKKGHDGDHWAPSGEVWSGGSYRPCCYISTCKEKLTVTRKMTVSGREGGRSWEREIQVCAAHDKLLDGMVQLGVPDVEEEKGVL